MSLSPLDRKIALMRAGVTMSAIARTVEPPVTANHVCQVVAGKRRSPRIEAAVAHAIKKQPDEVFAPREAQVA